MRTSGFLDSEPDGTALLTHMAKQLAIGHLADLAKARGARENAQRVATIGFEVYRFQLVAYVIAGMLGGLSGFLLANATDFVSPAYMSWQRSGELLIMVILGGMGTLNGAILGAAAFLLTEEWLSGLTEHWKVIFGPLLVLVAVFAPGGLIGFGTKLRRIIRG